MLVSVWEAMDAAIPRISAQEWMDSYIVQVVSNPYVDRRARENILNTWRTLITGKWRQITKQDGVVSTSSFLEDGTEVHRRVGLPLREIMRQVQNAFGRSIRD